jgi:hypothetical protein
MKVGGWRYDWVSVWPAIMVHSSFPARWLTFIAARCCDLKILCCHATQFLAASFRKPKGVALTTPRDSSWWKR